MTTNNATTANNTTTTANKPANHLDNLPGFPNLRETLANLDDSHYVRRRYLTADQLETVREYMTTAGATVRDLSQYDRERLATKRERLAGLVVPGVSDVVDLYDVEISNSRGGYYLSVSVTPYVVINSRVYSTDVSDYGKPGPVTLFYPFDLSNVRKTRNGWDYRDEEQPNRIGKATAKKLAAWVDYLDRRESAAAAYLDQGARALADLLAQIEAAGVEYNRNGDEITIYNGPFSMKCKIYDNCVTYHRPELDFYRYYKTIGGKFPGIDSGLAFILNAKVTF